MRVAIPAIQLSQVVKRFGETTALRGLSLAAAEGEVLVLLGHNGAGKTVTVRLLTTMSWPTSGTVSVGGVDTRVDPTAIRKQLGVCLDSPLLWPRLTGREHVHLMADAYDVPVQQAERAVNQVLERLGLDLPRVTPVADYSLGMKRKLGLALSLLHRPSVLVWDEPEIGLDAVSRIELRTYIDELRRQGTTIFLTTHALDLAEQLADRIAVLRRGALAAVDTPSGLRSTRQHNVSLEEAFLALLSPDDSPVISGQ
jgi:ABC-2 type transport system ATP-binding protein